MTYLPNPLNEYDTYTYNTKISMVSPITLQGDIPIAENSTDASFNISSITHTMVLGHSLVRNSYANQFDIIIDEPNNVTLFEKIVKSAQQLNIKNHVNATYKIQMTFMARDSEGTALRHSDEYVYYVKFLKVDADITERGAQYTIYAVETNAKGYFYIDGVTKNTLTYKASNVNEALIEFERVLNEAAIIHNETNVNSLLPDKYKVVLSDQAQDWGEWLIEKEETQNIEGDKVLFHITRGTKVDEHIGAILKATKEFKQYQLVSGGFAKPLDQEITDETAIGLKYSSYKVIPQVKNIEFDPLRGDYQKEITFVIYKHIMPETIIDSNQIAQSARLENQNRILKEYFDTGLLRKKYDYLYTGKNTEVLNFNIKLQYAYYLISPVFGGQVDHSNLRDSIEISEKVRSVEGAKSAYVRARNTLLQDLETTGGLSANLGVQFDESLAEFTKSADELWEISNKTPLPSFQSDVVDNSYSYVSESDEAAVALARFGSVQANIENSADLLEIELGIRGDPYWLGNPTGTTGFGGDSAPYILGGPMFFLNINLPRPENDNGQRPPSTEYYISGVYKVISVISEFRNGQFIQYLKAVRMTTVLTDQVAESLKAGRVSGPVSPTPTASVYTSGSQQPEQSTTGQNQSTRTTPTSTGTTPSAVTSQPTPRTSSPEATIEPSIPSPVNVQTEATEQNVLDLSVTNVIGIYGSPSNRSALIRFPDNSYSKVTVDDSLDNGLKVENIGETSITLIDPENPGKEKVILQLPPD